MTTQMKSFVLYLLVALFVLSSIFAVTDVLNQLNTVHLGPSPSCFLVLRHILYDLLNSFCFTESIQFNVFASYRQFLGTQSVILGINTAENGALVYIINLMRPRE